MALNDVNQEFDSQRRQVQQTNQWADHAQGGKISLYGELEMRNRLFREHQAKDCQEIEELRRICCEEKKKTSNTSKNWRILYASREESHDCESTICSNSGFTEQSKFLVRCERILRSWIMEQLWSVPRSTGTSGNVFERPPAREGLTSAFFNKSNNLASSSQDLRPEITGTTKRPESEMRREPWNTSIPLPHFQSGGGMLNHTGGTYSQVVWLIIRDSRFRNCIVGNSQTLWNFKAGKSTSRLKFVRKQHILFSQCTGSKKLKYQRQLTSLWHHDRLWGEQISRLRYAWCDDCVCIEEAVRQAHPLPEKGKCRRAACSKFWQRLTRETNCVDDLRAFSCNWSFWSGTRTIKFVQCKFAEWRRPRLRCSMGSSSTISERKAFRCDPERTVQVKITGPC